MQRLQQLANRLFLLSGFFVVTALGTSYGMLDEQQELFIPAIVKNYQQPNNLEASLLTILRDKETKTAEFRDAVNQLVPFMAARVFECLEMQSVTVATPVVQAYEGCRFTSRCALVPVVRSGEALVPGFQTYFKNAPVWHLLVQRDEKTAKARFIYSKLPKKINAQRKIIVLEPMIATGGSLSIVIKKLLKHGACQENIIIASFVAAPEGLQYLAEQFTGISVTVLSIDDRLNKKKYIEPGLGDFGDRFLGTDGSDED